MCVKTALTILRGYSFASKSLFRAAKEPSRFRSLKTPHPVKTTPRGSGEPKEGADLKCIPETAIKIVREEYSVIVFGLTTPKGATVCPRPPVVHPFSQDK